MGVLKRARGLWIGLILAFGVSGIGPGVPQAQAQSLFDLFSSSDDKADAKKQDSKKETAKKSSEKSTPKKSEAKRSRKAKKLARKAKRKSGRITRDNRSIMLLASGHGHTHLQMASELVNGVGVLDRHDSKGHDIGSVSVMAVAGKGGPANIDTLMRDVSIDAALTQTDVLRHLARMGKAAEALTRDISVIAKLWNDELHVLGVRDVSDIKSLDGQRVNFGVDGSASQFTGRRIFAALGIAPIEVNVPLNVGIGMLKRGEISASLVVAGKPMPAIANLSAGDGISLLSVPYIPALYDDYFPATLTKADYPDLIVERTSVDTIAVGAVMVAFELQKKDLHAGAVGAFVHRLFERLSERHGAFMHPKWQEANVAARLEGWQRYSSVQKWLDAREKDAGSSAAGFESNGQRVAGASGGDGVPPLPAPYALGGPNDIAGVAAASGAPGLPVLTRTQGAGELGQNAKGNSSSMAWARTLAAHIAPDDSAEQQRLFEKFTASDLMQ